MATKKELTDQRKALQRKVRSGSATAADKRKLKRIQIELGSKGKTTKKAPAPKAKRQRTDLGPMSEAARRNALIESVRSIDEDVAGRRPFAPVPQEEFIGQDRAFNAPRGDTVRPPVSREERMIGQDRAFNAPRGDTVRPPVSREERMIGQQRPDPSMMTAPMLRGVSRKSRPTGPVGPLPSPSDFERNPPVRSRDIDEDVAGRRGLPSLELMSKAPQADGFIGDEPGAPYRSSGGRGEMEGNRGYETLREYFIEDMSPRKSNVMTPFGIIEIDSTQEGMFPEEDMYMEKKGGRLKKKKRVARKKAAPKKKKVAAKKKPVVRKKAVAKKPPMRKKTVAKKPAGRKRAAKRGFGAELRGN